MSNQNYAVYDGRDIVKIILGQADKDGFSGSKIQTYANHFEIDQGKIVEINLSFDRDSETLSSDFVSDASLSIYYSDRPDGKTFDPASEQWVNI